MEQTKEIVVSIATADIKVAVTECKVACQRINTKNDQDTANYSATIILFSLKLNPKDSLTISLGFT